MLHEYHSSSLGLGSTGQKAFLCGGISATSASDGQGWPSVAEAMDGVKRLPSPRAWHKPGFLYLFMYEVKKRPLRLKTQRLFCTSQKVIFVVA
ncbi:MAG: hypothetical protein QMC95_03630 [Desulfitobacteriaceae bacterium]|nr:hypothetical protein [Desulfitobacteriaceae bacterium]MDI6879136.1 hypothetical protein [Desulfitobacteriaceae bacterium]MDI6913291.1 hypothetical protein [Desulfitobacteriaceae bacterium]